MFCFRYIQSYELYFFFYFLIFIVWIRQICHNLPDSLSNQDWVWLNRKWKSVNLLLLLLPQFVVLLIVLFVKYLLALSTQKPNAHNIWRDARRSPSNVINSILHFYSNNTFVIFIKQNWREKFEEKFTNFRCWF